MAGTPDPAAALAAGSAALGVALARPVALTDPVVLTGGDGAVVVRCRDGAGGDVVDGTVMDGTVVVKTFRPDEQGRYGFRAEAAGLALTSESGLAPRLLAVDPATLTVVMSDFGRAASLADLLLDGDAATAGPALVDWAGALGRLARWAAGHAPEHARLLALYPAAGTGPAGLADRILGTAGRAALLGVTEPAGLDADLRSVAEAVAPGRYPVFSPGDICPDNALMTAAGPRFLDYEGAGYHSVFLDAAYLRMPFSTCWCTFALPDGLARRAEAGYRAEVTAIHPGLADDGTWRTGQAHGVAAWTMMSMWWLLGRALGGDAPVDERPSPGFRQLMRHRWRVLAAELAATRQLPALAELVASLLAATEYWQAPELPLYPALRG